MPRGKKRDTEEFIKLAKEVHGDTYSYTKVDYVRARSLVIITCKVHGDFLAHPGNHLLGANCKKCADKLVNKDRTFSLEQHLVNVKEVHGDKYSYDKVEFHSGSQKVVVVCPVHGDFNISFNLHRSGVGCRECANEASSLLNKYTTEDFKRLAKERHQDKYDYSKSIYTGSWEKVEIGCPAHGVFSQNARQHVSGVGCPKCALNGYRDTKPGTFYILINENIVKVGITNRDVRRRLAPINLSSGMLFSVYHTIKLDDGERIRKLEATTLCWLRKNFKQFEPSKKFDGYTECFKDVCMESLLKFVIPLST
jgi:hypothetical protein